VQYGEITSINLFEQYQGAKINLTLANTLLNNGLALTFKDLYEIYDFSIFQED